MINHVVRYSLYSIYTLHALSLYIIANELKEITEQEYTVIHLYLVFSIYYLYFFLGELVCSCFESEAHVQKRICIRSKNSTAISERI